MRYQAALRPDKLIDLATLFINVLAPSLDLESTRAFVRT